MKGQSAGRPSTLASFNGAVIMNARNLFVVSVPVAILALALLAGSILLLQLLFLLVLVITASYLWTLLSLHNLSLRTGKLPEHIQVGDTFHRETQIFNPGKLPRLWLKVDDNADLPGHHDTAVINIARQSSYLWQTNFRSIKRGRYHVGTVVLTAVDPLGIFTRRSTLGEAQEITVYPATLDLPLFKIGSFGNLGHGSGYRTSRGVGFNASSVREFTSSDSTHHIHWRSTARVGKLMVKMFDADHSYNASKTVWVLVDMNKDSHFSYGEETSDEYAATIAASVVKNQLQSGMQVGMLSSDDHYSLIKPERGTEHLWNILEALALMRTEGKLKLSESVSQHLESFHDNPLVIIIATSASENLLETIYQLRKWVDPVEVILLDVSSFGGRPSSTEMTRKLTWSGSRVYSVRRGAELAKALDSRVRNLVRYV